MVVCAQTPVATTQRRKVLSLRVDLMSTILFMHQSENPDSLSNTLPPALT